MSKPLLVGVTGGIGSGKSTVCRILEVLQVPIYYADNRAKIMITEDQELRSQIIDLFGQNSYHGSQLNRSYLAEKVFNDEQELKKMNAVVHPAVAHDFERFAQSHSENPVLVKEAALLFETGSYQQLNKNIVVIAKKDERIQRVLLRDPQRARDQVEAIIAKQTSDHQRTKLADYVIHNDGDQLLIPQVLNIHQQLVSLAG